MRTWLHRTATTLATLATLAWLPTDLRSEEDQGQIPPSFSLGAGKVMVELFTSEGCSSCPRVDKAVQTLVNEAQAEGHEIHLLAWHVDYWDRLQTSHGVWADPYSDALYTQRQRAYAHAFVQMGLSERPVLVTPQVLFNGRPIQAIPGASTGDKMVAAAHGIVGQGSVSASVTREDDQLSVAWEVSGVAEDWQPGGSLTVAAVESRVASEITAGENHGLSMVHDHLVRVATMDQVQAASGSVTLALPDDWAGTDGAVLVVWQNRALGLVDLARLAVPEPTAALPAAVDPLADAIASAGVCGPDGCDLPAVATADASPAMAVADHEH